MYTLTTTDAAAILRTLKPTKYRSHDTLTIMLGSALARAQERGHTSINVYPFVDRTSVCRILDRYTGRGK